MSEDDEPGWVMGTISNTVRQHLARFQQTQMKLQPLTQPRWGDTAWYLGERRNNYGTCELIILEVVKPETNKDAATPVPQHLGSVWSVVILSLGYC